MRGPRIHNYEDNLVTGIYIFRNPSSPSEIDVDLDLFKLNGKNIVKKLVEVKIWHCHIIHLS